MAKKPKNLDEMSEEEKVKYYEKQEKLELEKKELINRVVGGNIKTKKDRVAFILSNHIPARDSDIELMWEYWKVFESHIFNKSYVNKEDLMSLTRLTTLSRSRATVQNDYKLFQASDEVRQRRGKLDQENREEVIEQKPNLPFYEVFIDETGKNQKYLSVGSLWVIDARSKFFAFSKIKEWVKKRNIKYEFHFSKVTKHKLDVYKDFFTNFLSWNPSVGFKAIVIDHKGISDIGEAITDLTFHLIHEGIKHEHSSKRAPLPRTLQVRLDQEEPGSDQLKLKNLEERILAQKINDLELDDFLALDSQKNYYIQAVDLFTAAVNRKLHNPINSGHPKDELAEHILNLLNFDINEVNKKNRDIDKSKVFNLTYKSQ